MEAQVYCSRAPAYLFSLPLLPPINLLCLIQVHQIPPKYAQHFPTMPSSCPFSHILIPLLVSSLSSNPNFITNFVAFPDHKVLYPLFSFYPPKALIVRITGLTLNRVPYYHVFRNIMYNFLLVLEDGNVYPRNTKSAKCQGLRHTWVPIWSPPQTNQATSRKLLQFSEPWVFFQTL